MGIERAFVYGLAVAGEATVRALRRRGVEVVVADDAVDDPKRTTAERLGVDLVETPEPDELRELLGSVDVFAPAPGLPETHRSFAVADDLGVDVVTEIELAYRWEQERSGGPRPMLAITGTDGKTTTTLMTVEMLRAAGVRTVDAGNTSTPLVDAIDIGSGSDDPALASEPLDAFVVECASFRLAWTPTFRPDAGAWLNLTPDHLNWHRSMESYEAAKARIWANQRPDDVAIGHAGDGRVAARLAQAPGQRRTFGGTDADYRLEGTTLVGPDGPIADRSDMRRSLPHDVDNALAAAALVLETGLATVDHVRAALGTFVGPPHRIEHVATVDDVAWFNDSKATTPHSASVAIHAFERIVLIAGGKDKEVDLSPMAAEPHRVDAVVALGQTRDAVAGHFAAADPNIPVDTVETLDRAVECAARRAVPGSTVLLSPGCASLDQYRSFEERGDEFLRLVSQVTGARTRLDDPVGSPPTPRPEGNHPR